jgi:hypothetical protein
LNVPQHKRDQLKAEIEAITQAISKELTTVGKMLPRLRATSKITNMMREIKTSKGAWLCSEETPELGKEEPSNLVPPEHQESQTPQSPKLVLESPEASQKDLENAKKESPKDENT